MSVHSHTFAYNLNTALPGGVLKRGQRADRQRVLQCFITKRLNKLVYFLGFF